MMGAREAAGDARIPGYVLSGGQSRRFGSDKARALVDGTPLLLRLIETVGSYCSYVEVVADRADRYVDLGREALVDLRPQCGPLGGLQAALADAAARGHHRLVLVSCDLLELRPHWLDSLVSVDGLAVTFRSDRWHPFPGVYRTQLSDLVEDRLERQELAFQPLLDEVGRALPLPGDWPLIAQANTPEELEAATKG